MKSVIIGQYIPGKGLFYKLDPRTKIIAVFLLMVSVFLFERIEQLLIALGVATLLLLVGKINIIRVIKGLKPIMILLIFTFVFQIMLNKQGQKVVEHDMYFTLFTLLFLVIAFILWRVMVKITKFRFTFFFLFVVSIYLILRYVDYGQTIIQPFNFTIREDG
ncbi:MAG: energy-coupling factor transporter transmembrane component T, partial [Candidatus Izemoplasmatales bacterium]